jgi:outer membrane lipoprotein-sorting protein
MKKYKVILIITLLFSSFAFSSSIITKEALVKKIQEFFKKNKTFRGKFTLIRKGMSESGLFFYQAPGRFKMVFAFTEEFKIEFKTIISTGKQLWVYLPSLKVVMDQDLTRGASNIAYSGAGLGFRRLIRKYSYEFLNNDNSLKTVPGLNEPVRILRLYMSRSFSGFKEIQFFVREDGFILKSRAVTQDDKIIELIRYDIKLNIDIDKRHFIFRVPKDAQIIRNPLVSSG